MVISSKTKERPLKKQQLRSLILRLADEIRRKYQPEKIILFGSHAYGQPTTHSDIDLFIVKDTDRPRWERFVEVSNLIFELGIGIPVEPHIYTPEELRDRFSLGDPFVLEILQKGKVLYDRPAETGAGMVSTSRK